MGDELIDLQCGVLTRKQAQNLGISDAVIQERIAYAEWQRLYWGVYATFPGKVPRMSRLWAAVLRAGPGAALSHTTAAELYGLADETPGPIHITVPRDRRVVRERDLVIHVSAYAEPAVDPAARPSRIRVEHTVLDLVAQAERLGDALGWVTRACGNRLTTAERLRAALGERTRLRWRHELEAALSDVGAGAQSVLELGYLRRCERAHGLPPARRQERVIREGRSQYRDVEYAEFGVIVELDGVIVHTDETRPRDRRRDNLNTIEAAATLRYGWSDVYDSPCKVTEQVHSALANRGWAGTPYACGAPSCPFPRSRPSPEPQP
ncbi:MAG: hypothetical protein GEV11_06690 [Streptosporangiales bacterium]|nr:hypothetical protein [Streptosporangiales bacterium]